MTVVDVDGTEPPEHFGFGDRLEIIAAESRRMSEVVKGLELEARVPSTPEWVPLQSNSAPISAARSAAGVSVVKNGFPMPAAKTTMRPFSRCRMARRLM